MSKPKKTQICNLYLNHFVSIICILDENDEKSTLNQILEINLQLTGNIEPGNSRLHQASDWLRDNRRGRRLIASSHVCDRKTSKIVGLRGASVKSSGNELNSQP